MMMSSASGTKSTFLVQDEIPCPCGKCSSKVRQRIDMAFQEPIEPMMVPTLSKVYSWSTVCLPCEHLSKEYYRYEPVSIDEDVESYLTEKRVINWCQAVNKLYPVRTTGDGNCLMHAVGLFMWGLQDEFMSLRKLVYSALIQSGTNSFRQRWQRERARLNENIPGGLQFNDEEWLKEWNIVVNAAQLTEQTLKNNKPMHSLEFLEEIHIFVLANVLRRPIIVLAEPTVLSPMLGDSIEHNNFVGIYLPLLWPPKECFRSPIILCFMLSHFLPLVVQNYCCKGALAYGVPLVTQAMEPLYIHFLMPEEDKTAHQLVQEYLYTSEVELTKKTINGNFTSEIILISEFDPAINLPLAKCNCPLHMKSLWDKNYSSSKETNFSGCSEISENKLMATHSKTAFNHNSPGNLQDSRTNQANSSLPLDVVAGTGKLPGVRMNEAELKCAFFFLHIKCLMVNCNEGVTLHSYPYHFCKEHEVEMRTNRNECVVKSYATKKLLYCRNSTLVAKHCFFFGCRKPMYKDSCPFCRDHAELKFLLNEFDYNKMWRLSIMTDSWSPKFLLANPEECLLVLRMLTIFNTYLFLMTYFESGIRGKQDREMFLINYAHKCQCELLQIKLECRIIETGHANDIGREKWQLLDDVTDEEILDAKNIFDILYMKPKKSAKCDVDGCNNISDSGGFCRQCFLNYMRTLLPHRVKNEGGGFINKESLMKKFVEVGSSGDTDHQSEDSLRPYYHSNKNFPSKELSRYGECQGNEVASISLGLYDQDQKSNKDSLFILIYKDNYGGVDDYHSNVNDCQLKVPNDNEQSSSVKSIESGCDLSGNIDEVDGVSHKSLYSNILVQQSEVPKQKDIITPDNPPTRTILKTGQKCLTSTCDLYGDPAYHGYCSHCLQTT